MKDGLLILISTVLTLLITLLLLRWLAPGLLGIPIDLQMVQVDKKVVPFFDNVFRKEDYQNQEEFHTLPDPYIRRGVPLYPDREGKGPHDLLGFRNRSIPHRVDLLIIGDSQTYGNNATLEQNWPSQLHQQFPILFPLHYNMSVGGWGAVEYAEIFTKAQFKPKMVIVAFYTGNDPLDSFMRAYSHPRWKKFRPNNQLTASDAPAVAYPPPDSSLWDVTFEDGNSILFVPTLRLASNQDHPAVKAGYGVMVKAATIIAKQIQTANAQRPKQQPPTRLIFTIIPTKSWVYAARIKKLNLIPPADYQTLIARETDNIAWLAQQLQQLPDASYADVTQALRQVVETNTLLFPARGGHPLAAGYKVIADALASHITNQFTTKDIASGLVGHLAGENLYRVYLLRNKQLWLASNSNILRRNGWDVDKILLVKPTDIQYFPLVGVVDKIDVQFAAPTQTQAE